MEGPWTTFVGTMTGEGFVGAWTGLLLLRRIQMEESFAVATLEKIAITVIVSWNLKMTFIMSTALR